MYSCSSLLYMYPSLPQHALIRSWSTTRIRSNPSRHPAKKLGSAIAKTCFPGLFPHFTRLIRTMPLGLFTLVSRVNFVGAMRNEFSQSGGGIFAVDRSEMNHSRLRYWGFGDTASIFRPDRAVSELGLGLHVTSMSVSRRAQLRTQRRTRTHPSHTFPLGTSVEDRVRVSHPRITR